MAERGEEEKLVVWNYKLVDEKVFSEKVVVVKIQGIPFRPVNIGKRWHLLLVGLGDLYFRKPGDKCLELCKLCVNCRCDRL